MKLTRRGEIVALETILELQEDLCGTEVLNKCFHVALRHNEDKLVTLLLSYGVDPNFESAKRYYGSALHECAYYGNVTMARALLGHPGGVKDNMVNSLVGQYHTPLIAAVSWKYQKLSRNSRKIKPVKQRLIKQRKMVEYLIEQGGNPMIKGGRYGTMLNAAVAAGEPDLVTFILDKVGFDVHEEDDEGRSAAHIGCSALNERDTTDNLRVLCKKFGSSGLLLATDKHGRLPLHFACGSQRLDVLHYLLSDSMSKDKINEPDNDGWTPLHWACRQWDILLIRCLVDSHGAKTDCHTKDGWTPWDVAIFHDNSGFASALKRKDTTPDADGHVIKEGKRWSAVCNSCTVSQKILLLYHIEYIGLTGTIVYDLRYQIHLS
jgi:ankyrin repeat protein